MHKSTSNQLFSHRDAGTCCRRSKGKCIAADIQVVLLRIMVPVTGHRQDMITQSAIYTPEIHMKPEYDDAQKSAPFEP